MLFFSGDVESRSTGPHGRGRFRGRGRFSFPRTVAVRPSTCSHQEAKPGTCGHGSTVAVAAAVGTRSNSPRVFGGRAFFSALFRRLVMWGCASIRESGRPAHLRTVTGRQDLRLFASLRGDKVGELRKKIHGQAGEKQAALSSRSFISGYHHG